jgi:ABC-type transport system substrate-binding protein
VASFDGAILDVPSGRGGLIPPLMPGHTHDVGIGYEPERARALLAEAGHAGGKGIQEITVLLFDFFPHRVVEELGRQLGEIGLAVRFELIPFHEYPEAVKRRGHMFMFAWTPDVPDPASVFDSQFSEYPFVYRDESLLELLARARGETDRDERLRLYREIDRLIVAEHASIVPVSYRRAMWHRRPWVSKLRANGYYLPTLDGVTVDAELRDELRRSAPTRGAGPPA